VRPLAYKAFDFNSKTLSFEELGLNLVVMQGKPLIEIALEVFRGVTRIVDQEHDENIHLYRTNFHERIG